jgi:hypothetical protein
MAHHQPSQTLFVWPGVNRGRTSAGPPASAFATGVSADCPARVLTKGGTAPVVTPMHTQTPCWRPAGTAADRAAWAGPATPASSSRQYTQHDPACLPACSPVPCKLNPHAHTPPTMVQRAENHMGWCLAPRAAAASSHALWRCWPMPPSQCCLLVIFPQVACAPSLYTHAPTSLRDAAADVAPRPERDWHKVSTSPAATCLSGAAHCSLPSTGVRAADLKRGRFPAPPAARPASQHRLGA